MTRSHVLPKAIRMQDVTQILNAIEQGDPSAAEQLLLLVYQELRKLAAAKMAQEKPGQMLQATALVHKAYLRLVDTDQSDTGTVAGTSLGPPRGDAADFGRTRATQAWRCSRWRTPTRCLVTRGSEFQEDQLDVLALSNALDRLRGLDPRAAGWSNSGTLPD